MTGDQAGGPAAAAGRAGRPFPNGFRWGILGAARIAASSFLPGLAEAGGTAVAVGARDGARAAAFAAEHGVGRGVAGYEAVLDAPDVDGVYVALPNALHAEWTAAALRAGKAVLCEKPLATSAAEAASVLDVAASTGGLLWEAFVFPLQAQHGRILELLAGGAIGEVREAVSSFHFRMAREGDIRLSAALGGGALADVGCYPVRLGQLLLGEATAWAAIGSYPDGADPAGGDDSVDTELAGVVGYEGGRRLLLTCGFDRAGGTATTILGTEGEMAVANPFHPKPPDAVVVHRPGSPPVTERPTTDERSFAAALRHIHAACAGAETPRHLAADDSLATAVTIDSLRAAARAGAA